MIPPRRRPFMNRTGDSQPRHLSRTGDRCHIRAMRKPLFAIAMLATAASAIGRPALKAGELSFKNGLLEWHLAWPAEVSAIPQLLAFIRSAAIKERRELLAAAATQKAERGKLDAPFNGYESAVEVASVGQTPRLLSLTKEWYEDSGGAHPNHGTSAMLWDRALSRKIAFDSLFTGGAAGSAAVLRKSYCAALDKERLERRGPEDAGAGDFADDPFYQCPKFAELAFIPQGKAGAPFGSVTIHADPYVAGPYVEADYDISLPVTSALVAALKPQYRASFAPAAH